MAVSKTYKKLHNLYLASFTGATQSDGAQTLDVSAALPLNNFNVQIVTHGTVTAGTLAVGIRLKSVPATASHQDMSTTIDMTSPSVMNFTCHAASLQFTPTSFDGDTYDVYVVID
jgi:hypothetical protein